MQSEVSQLRAMSSEPQTDFARPGTSQELEDFIYLISHDVRASVRALIELPQWITEDLEEAGVKINGSVESSIELMNRHTGRLDRMLVDLLAFSRVGRMQAIEDVDLDAGLDEVLDDMNIPASFTIQRQLEQPSITMGDRDALTLMRALVSNAIKHHDKPKGRVQVASECEGAFVVLSVCDDGPGIPEAFQEKVFGPMTTLRPRDEVEGSGMGLAVVKKIALQSGGGVRIGPSPFGRGTQIEVRLPIGCRQ